MIDPVTTTEPSAPLFGDPSREASASMRGYWAQVWRSVLAWIQLDETERLYLEGAEDIDIISGSSAETIQVKDKARKITLRSTDAIDAINNAWEHQQRNPRHKVRFRLLTTAQIAIERGQPFGNHTPGIALWQETRSAKETEKRHLGTKAISRFLIAEGKLNLAVLDFLRSSSDEDVWSQLVAVLDWDTNADRSAEVIQDVKNALVLVGERHSIDAATAEAVADHLYAIVYATATRESDRYLSRADFLRAFTNRTHQALPTSTVNALLALITNPPLGTSLPNLPVVAGNRSNPIVRPPPLPALYHDRKQLLAQIQQLLSTYPIVVLQGGTGVGKSLIATAYARASQLKWGWIDLRGHKSPALHDILDQVLDSLRVSNDFAHIILDDLPSDPDVSSLEPKLSQIQTMLFKRDGQLLVTSSSILAHRLQLRLGMPSANTIVIPRFSLEEIRDFTMVCGCTDSRLAFLWAKFIEIHTAGHAQLVHARIATIAGQGFPAPELDRLHETPVDVEDARSEARRLVSSLSAQSRDLLYRLSLITQPLSRQQIIAIASEPVSIPEPGLHLDNLIGPWIEPAFDRKLRVSPLLQMAGRDVMGNEWAIEAHQKISRGMLRSQVLTTTDVSSILFHAFIGRDWTSFARLTYGLLKADERTWEAIATTGSWLLYIDFSSDLTSSTFQAFPKFLIRLLQFRVALAKKETENVLAALNKVDLEFPQTTAEMPLLLMRFNFLGQTLANDSCTIPISRRLQLAVDYIGLVDQTVEVLADVYQNAPTEVTTGPDGGTDVGVTAGFFLTQSIIDRFTLAELVSGCQQLDARLVRRLLWFMGKTDSTASFVLERIWLAEMESPTRDWPAHREVVQRTYDLSRKCELPGLARAAARSISRITDENLGRPAEALELADAIAAAIGWSPTQEDGRAWILHRAGRSQEALAIWRRVLPTWERGDEFEVQQVFSYRQAAIAAGELNSWSDAAIWLRGAGKRANTSRSPALSAGLLVDEGFALWKSGENRLALDCFAAGVAATELLGQDTGDAAAFVLRKRIGHTLLCVAHTALGITLNNLTLPPAGFCSSMEPSEQLEKLPPTPSDALWIHLIEIEYATDLGSELFSHHEARLRNSPYLIYRLSFNNLRLRHRIRSLSLIDYMEVIAEWAEAFWICRRYYKEGGLPAYDPLPPNTASVDREQLDTELILIGVVRVLFALAGRQDIDSEMIERWGENAAKAGVYHAVKSFLDFVQTIFVTKELNPMSAVKDETLSWVKRFAASVKVATDVSTGPEEMLLIHNFWVMTLLDAGTAISFEEDADRLVAAAWMQLANRGFLLRAPALSVPSLKRACASKSRGWRKVGEILLEATDAVRISVPIEIRSRLRSLLTPTPS